MAWIVSWNKPNTKTRQTKEFGDNQEAALEYARGLDDLGEKFASNIEVKNKPDANKKHWYFG